MNSEEKEIMSVINMFDKHLRAIYNNCKKVYDKFGREAVPDIQLIIDGVEGSIDAQRTWLNSLKRLIK